jgi:hypothetical protein
MMKKFDDFMQSQPKTDEGELLVQAIAILSTQPKYEHLTPGEVYDVVVKQTREVKEHIKKMSTI